MFSNTIWQSIFAVLSLQLLVGGCVYAAELESQILINNNAPIIKHSIITEEHEQPAIKLEPWLAELLQRFRQQPDNLKLVADLNVNKELLLNHVRQRSADETNAVSLDEAMELIAALSLINDSEATDTIATLGLRFIDNPEKIYYLLRTLRELPVTESVQAYLTAIFEKNRDSPQLIRSALLYYVAVKDTAGLRWAAYYRSPGIDSQLRFAGLTLAAILSKDDQVTRWILDELKAEPAVPTYQQYYLLQGLYARITEAEFDHLLPRLSVAPVMVKEFQRVRDFDKAIGEQKFKLADYMLASPHTDQQQKALTYYLENHKVMDVWPKLDTHKRLSAIRLANTHGLALLPVAKQEVSTPEDSGPEILYAIAGFLLLVLLLAGFRRLRHIAIYSS